MKVLIVDDHSLVSEGIALILKKLHPKAESVCADSFAEALTALHRQTGFDLILLDLSLGDVADLAGLRQLRELYPEIPVIVISATRKRATVLEALDSGAMGFIPKSATTSALADALWKVLRGGIYVPSVTLDQLPAEVASNDLDETQHQEGLAALHLTPREAQVLTYLMQGLSNKHIARILDISDSTVRKHVTTVLRALRVRSRTEAVLEVARRGLFLYPLGTSS